MWDFPSDNDMLCFTFKPIISLPDVKLSFANSDQPIRIVKFLGCSSVDWGYIFKLLSETVTDLSIVNIRIPIEDLDFLKESKITVLRMGIG